MSSKIQFQNLGTVHVIRVAGSGKAALVRFDSGKYADRWVAFSNMATHTAQQCRRQDRVEHFRVKDWVAGQIEESGSHGRQRRR